MDAMKRLLAVEFDVITAVTNNQDVAIGAIPSTRFPYKNPHYLAERGYSEAAELAIKATHLIAHDIAVVGSHFAELEKMGKAYQTALETWAFTNLDTDADALDQAMSDLCEYVANMFTPPSDGREQLEGHNATPLGD